MKSNLLRLLFFLQIHCQNLFYRLLQLKVIQTAKDDQLLWVAVQHHEDMQEHSVGYVMVNIVDRLVLVAQMDVHPQHGHKGFGTALLTHAIQHMQKKGFVALYLTIFSNIQWNTPFYEKFGFVSMDEMNIPRAITEILCKERSCRLHNRIGMRLAFVTH